jgi:hypothetical protein
MRSTSARRPPRAGRAPAQEAAAFIAAETPAGDRSIPAGRIREDGALVLVDRLAAGEVTS